MNLSDYVLSTEFIELSWLAKCEKLKELFPYPLPPVVFNTESKWNVRETRKEFCIVTLSTFDVACVQSKYLEVLLVGVRRVYFYLMVVRMIDCGYFNTIPHCEGSVISAFHFAYQVFRNGSYHSAEWVAQQLDWFIQGQPLLVDFYELLFMNTSLWAVSDERILFFDGLRQVLQGLGPDLAGVNKVSEFIDPYIDAHFVQLKGPMHYL